MKQLRARELLANDESLIDGVLQIFHGYNNTAPWCSHCRNFATEYEQVAQSLHSDEDLGIKVAKVDGKSFWCLNAT